MKNIQKVFLGGVLSLAAIMPALGENFSQFDVKGTIDNSISVQVYDSGNNLFSDTNNNSNIPVINFGKINTLGKTPATADIGAGIGGVKVNTFLAYSNARNLISADTLGPGVNNIAGGLFAINATGGAIRVQVDSTASTNSNLSVDYSAIDGTPPDLVLAADNVPLIDGSILNSDPMSRTVVIPAGYSAPIAGTGGYISSQPLANGNSTPLTPTRLGMNIGLLALKPYTLTNGGPQVSLTNGAFTGRVKFIATAL